MKIEPWLVWGALAALFVLGEILTTGFFLMLFAIGAGVAAALAGFGLPLWMQLLAFVIVSAVLIPFSRKFADKMTKEPPEKFGAERLVGKSGMVIEKVDPKTAKGRVRVDGDEWRADSENNTGIEEGKRVEVCCVTGSRLIVKLKESEE
ncbi:MAG TPA: NfeD family protein [bacterium]|nr:NfeD family protein [bacterium]HPI75841.1 NfeD family protein [bacterium]